MDEDVSGGIEKPAEHGITSSSQLRNHQDGQVGGMAASSQVRLLSLFLDRRTYPGKGDATSEHQAQGEGTNPNTHTDAPRHGAAADPHATTTSSQGATAQHPPTDGQQNTLTHPAQDAALKSLMMSLYWSGHYTGLHRASQEALTDAAKILLETVKDEAIKPVATAWYWSGYYSGVYEAARLSKPSIAQPATETNAN
jgi:hypothetical protein